MPFRLPKIMQGIDSQSDSILEGDQPSPQAGANQGQERNPDAPLVKTKNEVDEAAAKEQRKDDALRELVTQCEREDEPVRRPHFKRWMQAEEFWKGNHHSIWDAKENRFRTPFEWALENNKTATDLPRYQYVTNIYQSYGLSVIAAISQRLPKVRFQPKSAKSERDIATANAASDVCDLIERNNDLDTLAVREAYLAWTQGFIAGYVRYVLDKDFGTQQVPQIEMQQVTLHPDQYHCPQCGADTPAADVETGLAPTPPQCKCGYQLTDQDFQPEEVGEGAVITQIREMPNGREVVTIYGATHVKVMPYAQTQKDTGYLILVEDMHKAALKASYPGKAGSIGGAASAEDTYERAGRAKLTEDNGSMRTGAGSRVSSIATLKRAWLRSWMLWSIEDKEIRDALIQEYPDGVFVALEGETVLEKRAESMDKHWELCMPMPGQGAYREAIGSSTISVNIRHNDASNIAAEHIEFASMPPVFVNAKKVNMEALRTRRMTAANFFPISPTDTNPQTELSKLMYQPQLRVDSNIYSYGKDLIELAQVTSGAMPTIFGGQLKGNDTASGYSMAREQSLGKLNLFWRAVKQFHARLMLKAVEVFKEERTEDYEHVVEGKSGDFASKYVHLEDLKGNITAHPEADEDFPTSWTEIRANLTALIRAAPDEAKALLFHPSNSSLLRKYIANPDVVIPVEDTFEKQYREIDILLKGQPQQVNTPTGFELMPSVMPDVFNDDHDSHILTINQYTTSDAGMEQKRVNPVGYANICAHGLEHIRAKAQKEAAIQLIAQQAMQQAMPAPPPGAPQPADQPPNGAAPQGGETVGDKLEKVAPGALATAKDILSTKTGQAVQ